MTSRESGYILFVVFVTPGGERGTWLGHQALLIAAALLGLGFAAVVLMVLMAKPAGAAPGLPLPGPIGQVTGQVTGQVASATSAAPAISQPRQVRLTPVAPPGPVAAPTGRTLSTVTDTARAAIGPAITPVTHTLATVTDSAPATTHPVIALLAPVLDPVTDPALASTRPLTAPLLPLLTQVIHAAAPVTGGADSSMTRLTPPLAPAVHPAPGTLPPSASATSGRVMAAAASNGPVPGSVHGPRISPAGELTPASPAVRSDVGAVAHPSGTLTSPTGSATLSRQVGGPTMTASGNSGHLLSQTPVPPALPPGPYVPGPAGIPDSSLSSGSHGPASQLAVLTAVLLLALFSWRRLRRFSPIALSPAIAFGIERPG